MPKGIVMEANRRFLIVMTREGEFIRLPNRRPAVSIGEEIAFEPTQVRRSRKGLIYSCASVLAAAMLCLFVVSGIQFVQARSVVAYVSVDINPSVELGIDRNQLVRRAKGLNEAGARLLEGIDYKGRPLSAVTEQLVLKAGEQEWFGQGQVEIIIATSLVKTDSGLDDALLSQAVKQEVEEIVNAQVAHFGPDQAPQVMVASFVVPEEVHEEASKAGLSQGKYTIYLRALSEGLDLSVEDLQEQPIGEIAKSLGGVAGWVDQLEKQTLRELLEAEKQKQNAASAAVGPAAAVAGEQNDKKADANGGNNAKGGKATGNAGKKDKDDKSKADGNKNAKDDKSKTNNQNNAKDSTVKDAKGAKTTGNAGKKDKDDKSKAGGDKNTKDDKSKTNTKHNAKDNTNKEAKGAKTTGNAGKNAKDDKSKAGGSKNAKDDKPKADGNKNAKEDKSKDNAGKHGKNDDKR